MEPLEGSKYYSDNFGQPMPRIDTLTNQETETDEPQLIIDENYISVKMIVDLLEKDFGEKIFIDMSDEDLYLAIKEKIIDVSSDFSTINFRNKSLFDLTPATKAKLFALFCVANDFAIPSPGKRVIYKVRDSLKNSHTLLDLLLNLNFEEIKTTYGKNLLSFSLTRGSIINELSKTSYPFEEGSIFSNIIGDESVEMAKIINEIGRTFSKAYIENLENKTTLVAKTKRESLPTDIWKNPRPNKPNTKEIKKGDLVNVDGMEPLQLVEKIQGDKVMFGRGKGIADKSKAYPMYEQKSTIPLIGNIVVYNRKPYIVTSIDEEGTKTIVNTTSGVSINVEKIEKVYAGLESKEPCSIYKCGTIHYDNKTYSCKEHLLTAHPAISFKFNEIDISLDHKNIADHYGIDIAMVKPKELTMLSLLREALDHPLNVKAKEWACIVGPSGTGKTELVVDYANRANKRYIKLQGNAQVTVDDLIGYKSITDGTYFPSLLREAVEEGLVFIIDEIDACNPNTLLTLNGLKQEYFQFPDELVKIHPEFRLVATANTLEYSEEYNSRSPMDKATKARFDVIQYDMEKHELAIRYGLNRIKDIPNIDRLTPREVSRLVTKMKIKEEREKEAKENERIQKENGEKEAC